VQTKGKTAVWGQEGQKGDPSKKGAGSDPAVQQTYYLGGLMKNSKTQLSKEDYLRPNAGIAQGQRTRSE